MRAPIKMAMTFTAMFALASCQTGNPSMSLEEAKQVTADLSDNFSPPPKSIDDLLARLPKRDNSDTCKYMSPMSDEEFRKTMAALPAPVQGSPGRVGFAEQRAYRAFEVGKYADAVKYMRAALSAITGNLRGYRVSRTAMYASLLAYAGEYDKAATSASVAENLMPNVRPTRWRQTSFDANSYLLNEALAAVAQSRGRLVEAEAYYRRALEFNNKVPSSRYQSWGEFTRIELAGNLGRQGRLLEAENVLRGIIQSRGHYDLSSPVVAKALSRLSIVLYEQGHYADAEALARATLRVYKILCAEPESLSVATVRDVLGKSLVAQESWGEAIEVYEAARVAMAKDPQSYQRLFAGNLYRALALLRAGKMEQAEAGLKAAFQRSREQIGETDYKTAEIRGFLAMTRAAKGDRAGALRDFTEATDILLTKSRETDDEDASFRARDRRLAIIFGAYIDLLTDLRGTSLLADSGLDAVAESFRLAEVARARSVQRALSASGARASLGDPQLIDLARREQDLQKQISTLYVTLSTYLAQPDSGKKVREVRASIEKFRKAKFALASELERRFPQYAELIKPQPATIKDAKAHLRRGEAMISTYVGSNRTYIWLIPQNGEIAFNAVDITSDDVTATVDEIRRTLYPGSITTLGDIPEFDLDTAHDVYEKLLAPVLSGQPDVNQLVVVAHGPLGQLPFSLLPTKSHELAPETNLLFGNYRGVPWLARDYAVTMLPSVSALAALRQPRAQATASPQPFVGFGDPLFSKEQAANQAAGTVEVASASLAKTRGLNIRLRAAPVTRSVNSATLALLPRLHDTRPELLSVARSLGVEPESAVYLGSDASEGRVKSMDLSGVGVLAFATHGLVPGDLNGLDQPALALSAPSVTGEKGDGLLTMGEILSLKLNADWVVLSACNTASADGQGAGAVSGLGRAFFYAGARALLVSNWPVHSAATTELMSTLFRAQAEDAQMTRAEALRRARVHLVDKGEFKGGDGAPIFSYAHPLFWAPFTIVGDGGRGRRASS